MAKSTIRNIICDGCGGKCSAPYARWEGKQYCRRECYVKAKADAHHSYSDEVVEKQPKDYEEYPDNSRDGFDDSGC